MSAQEKFAGWAILELLDGTRFGGYVHETVVAGTGALVVEITPKELAPGVRISLGDGTRTTMIDVDDAPLVTRWRWRNANGYAMRKRRGQHGIYLHRFLTDAPAGKVVDHKNGDKLDNRRGNLRVCSHADNIRAQRHHTGATSRFRGVFRESRSDKWVARIRVMYRTFQLGTFADEREAAKAYDLAAFKRFGEFAGLNFPAVRFVRPADLFCLTVATESLARSA